MGYVHVHWSSKGYIGRNARIRRLLDRHDQETDPKALARLEAQLFAYGVRRPDLVTAGLTIRRITE
jgi:hypothetical protein